MDIFCFSTPPAIVQQAPCSNDTAKDDCAAECKEKKCTEDSQAQDDCEQECEDECEQQSEE